MKIGNLVFMKYFKPILIGFIGFAIFAVLFMGAIGFAIYRFSSDAAIVKGMCRLIPYPAARVNWHLIRCSEYFFDVDTLTYFYKGQEAQAGMPAPDMQQVKQNVLERLINNYFVEKIAEDNQVAVSKEEVEGEYGQISEENNGEENLKKMLKEYYDWTPDIFKQRVIYYSLLDEKLVELLGEDELTNEIEKRRGEATIEKYIK